MKHPANFLSKIDQNTLLIEIATRNVVCLAPDDSVGAAASIMAEKRFSSIVITDDKGSPQGIVTERNVLKAMQSACSPDEPLKRVMSAPVISVSRCTTCIDAYQVCRRKGIRHLVIVDDDNQLCGVVTETDFRIHLDLHVLSGRRKIASVMRQSQVCIPPDASVLDAVDLMQNYGETCVVIAEAGCPLGIVTERDIVRFYSDRRDCKELSVAKVMTSPVLTIPLNGTINEAAEAMLKAKVRHLVVVDRSQHVAGLVNEHDLTENLAAKLLDEKLIADSAFLHTLIDTIPDMIWVKDVNGVYLACNRRFERFFGSEEANIVGKTDYDFVSEKQAAFFRGNDRKAMENDGPSSYEERVVYADDGHEELIETIKTPMRDRQGHVLGVLGIARDITDRKAAEENLRITASVFDNSQEAILITDADNAIVNVNSAFTKITGYSREEVLGRNPNLLNSGRQNREFYARMWNSLDRDKTWRGEIWNRRKSGEIYAEMLSITVICDRKGRAQHYVAVFSDISQLKAHEAELSRVAYYDALTGVPNRLLLTDRLRQALIRAQRSQKMVAICYMDLDGFKQVNDQCGHEAGDCLLVDVTHRLQHVLRADDTLARLGGDEFVLLLNELQDEQECLKLLDRILDIVATPAAGIDLHVAVSASIGVTFFPGDSVDGDILIRHADQAMYIAKQRGRNRYHLYNPEHDQRLQELHEARRRVIEGLDKGEFELFYQPKIVLESGELIGAEALIRWRHPERGLLLPGEFLPIIADSDIEIRLGEFVMEQALRQLDAWRRQGLVLEVSINISARHLQSQGFVTNLESRLANYSLLPPWSLEIEMLETAALEDIHRSSETIETCHRLGVNIALDDFGTGYSSLMYLRQLLVDTVKIDQSFVRGMMADRGDRAIVEGIVALAKAFDRKTVAEGVEMSELFAELNAIGCLYGQGYAIARPMPAEYLPAWHRERQMRGLMG
jgi:diguanylate cyclase (GGDEF)-like protein/PAS domain S-box-containing protein